MKGYFMHVRVEHSKHDQSHFQCQCVCFQLILDSQKRVFTWGFGGYGRLGHTEQKDEMVPRLVKLFDFPGRGASQICTGYQCSFAVSEMGKSSTFCHMPTSVLIIFA